MKLQIVDIGWGIDRKSGTSSENEVCRITFESPTVGPLAPVGPARKVFSIVEVKDNSLVILLSQKQGKVEIKRGETYTYRPVFMDAGHYYLISVE